MPEPIIIYDVRENCAHTDEENTLYVESISIRYFQTMASAQLYLQEMINTKVALRLEGGKRYPNAFQNTPEAIAATAANKLYVDESHYRIPYPEVFKNMPIFFIKELKVLY